MTGDSYKIGARSYYARNSAYAFETLCEREYIRQLVQNLELRLSDDIQIVVYSTHNSYQNPVVSSGVNLKKAIVLCFSDEESKAPIRWTADVGMLCKAYVKSSLDIAESSIFPMPIGYVDGFVPAPKSENERDVSVFFSGALNKNRALLYKDLAGLWWVPNLVAKILARRAPEVLLAVGGADVSASIPGSLIKFSSKFRSGMDAGLYAEMLGRSRYALCPWGYVSAESFRITEAAMSGAVIISGRLPDTWIYNNSPCFQSLGVKNQRKTIIDLVSNNDVEYHNLQRKQCDWYNCTLAPSAVARRISEAWAQARRPRW